LNFGQVSESDPSGAISPHFAPVEPSAGEPHAELTVRHSDVDGLDAPQARRAADRDPSARVEDGELVAEVA
jgi:hypothetical protein